MASQVSYFVNYVTPAYISVIAVKIVFVVLTLESYSMANFIKIGAGVYP